ncbi:MAG: hypothetical protein LBL66_01490 [Clostridiales bacterium]|nr:hypothetical protein [Clostridiales bacterium]
MVEIAASRFALLAMTCGAFALLAMTPYSFRYNSNDTRGVCAPRTTGGVRAPRNDMRGGCAPRRTGERSALSSLVPSLYRMQNCG